MCAQKAITRATWQSNNLWENSKTKVFLLYMLLYYIHIKYTTYLCIRTYRSYFAFGGFAAGSTYWWQRWFSWSVSHGQKKSPTNQCSLFCFVAAPFIVPCGQKLQIPYCRATLQPRPLRLNGKLFVSLQPAANYSSRRANTGSSGPFKKADKLREAG